MDYEQPTKYLVTANNYSKDFETPVLTAGKTFVLGYTNEKSGIYRSPLPVIIFDDFTTASKYVDFAFKAKSSAIKILRAKDASTNLRFMFEVMQRIDFPRGDEHKRRWIDEYSKQAVSIPSPSEQSKISSFLSAVADRIYQLERKLELLKEYKRSAMENIFSRKIRFRSMDGGEFPEWVTVFL